jgi:hypothetical protein
MLRHRLDAIEGERSAHQWLLAPSVPSLSKTAMRPPASQNPASRAVTFSTSRKSLLVGVSFHETADRPPRFGDNQAEDQQDQIGFSLRARFLLRIRASTAPR